MKLDGNAPLVITGMRLSPQSAELRVVAAKPVRMLWRAAPVLTILPNIPMPPIPFFSNYQPRGPPPSSFGGPVVDPDGEAPLSRVPLPSGFAFADVTYADH